MARLAMDAYWVAARMLGAPSFCLLRRMLRTLCFNVSLLQFYVTATTISAMTIIQGIFAEKL